jgi:hypothetical protein
MMASPGGPCWHTSTSYVAQQQHSMGTLEDGEEFGH